MFVQQESEFLPAQLEDEKTVNDQDTEGSQPQNDDDFQNNK